MPQRFYQRALSADSDEIIAARGCSEAQFLRQLLRSGVDAGFAPGAHRSQDRAPSASISKLKVRGAMVAVIAAIGGESVVAAPPAVLGARRFERRPPAAPAARTGQRPLAGAAGRCPPDR
jgi:hypothetical protein